MNNWSEVFDYEQGELFWKKPRKKAGGFTNNGDKRYRTIGYRNKKYYAHRVIWEMFNGEIPPNHVIDHINGNGIDNRVENLRIISIQENLRNSNLSKANTSGVTGVSFDNKTQKWVAQITVNHKKKNLGRFNSKTDAINARLAAEKEHGFNDFHGRNSNLNW